MKLPLKITGILLIFSLLTSCVAATENKDLPTKEEITDFIAEIPVSENYINTVFDALKDKQPTWNCDIWVDKKTGNQILSLYYVDLDSPKEYGVIYLDELGKEISMRGVEAQLVESYVGEAVSKENTDNTVQTTDETIQTTDETEQSVGDEQLAEYEEQLDEYEKDQSVDYRNKSGKSANTSDEDESQSAEDMTKTVDDAAHTVENAAKTVEMAQKVENPEETKWYEKISFDMVVGVFAVFIACKLRFYRK